MLTHLHNLLGYSRAAREPIKSVSLLFSKRQQAYQIFFVFSTIAFVFTRSDSYYERSFITQGSSLTGTQRQPELPTADDAAR